MIQICILKLNDLPFQRKICNFFMYNTAPLPPKSADTHYFQEPGEPISIEAAIYHNYESVQTHYVIGCSSAEDPTICSQTHYINATAGMCYRAEILLQ